MSRFSLFAVVMGLYVIGVVEGQERQVERADQGTVVHHHYYGGGAPGYGNGYGGGFAQGGIASGVGDMRESTSEAAENYAQTAHMVQENHNYAVNSYYANKDAHDAYTEAHRKGDPTEAELQKFAHVAEPGRLSSVQFDRATNVINWPAYLRDSAFNKPRHNLDLLFDQRTPENSGADSDNYIKIKQQCGAMKEILVQKLRSDNLPSVTFTCSEHFIKSVNYEALFVAK